MEDFELAITPAYPFGAAGAPILLHAGSLEIGGQSVIGSIEFRLLPRPEIIWRVDSHRKVRADEFELVIDHATGPARLVARQHRSGQGTIETVEVGATEADLDRVVVHWLNLPAIRSPYCVEDPTDGMQYSGRWSAVVDGWAVTLDRRSDHREIWLQIRDDSLAAVTHVMELRRVDAGAFRPSDVEPVLSAMHLGMSFALGRWVAPALPVGFDRTGRRVWEQWGVRFSTIGAPGTLGWWWHQQEWELAELLERTVERFSDPEQQFSLRFLLSSAVLSASGGFVEQRIMTAFAAIEHLTWTRLVTIGGMSKSEYGKLRPHYQRLERALAEAKIPDGVEREMLPALYDAVQRRPDVVPRSGPAIACHVRNMIVHPTDHEDELYRRDEGLVTQGWLLTHHYLVLLILHHLGYSDTYQPLLRPNAWEGTVELVPWAPVSGLQHNQF
ncbi:MAG: hypothetical protein ACR2GH_18890 [Pseudonocardia sp.]